MKRLIIFLVMLLVMGSAFLFHIFQRDADGVPILNYYQVNDVDENPFTLKVDQFDAQIKYLIDEGYSIITPDELLNAWQNGSELPKNPVILTFDGGNVDIYKNVFPILQKYNVRATIFVVTDYVNLYPNHITWQQAREMQSSGLIDIESHTLNNKLLTQIRSESKLWDQIYGSKQALEWHLKKPVNFIAYPDGKYTVEAEDMSKEVGYTAAFTNNYGLAKKDEDDYVLSRIPIYGSNSHTLLRFKMRLKGAPLIAPLTRFKQHLIDDGNPEVAGLIILP